MKQGLFDVFYLFVGKDTGARLIGARRKMGEEAANLSGEFNSLSLFLSLVSRQRLVPHPPALGIGRTFY